MTSGGGLEDLSLIELFRAEVETHSEVLNSALLDLDRAPGDTSRLGEMMRAAHSIKGAARVVGVEPAVSVAHIMEDCFVAAQRGILLLSPADVDVLLQGVDLLGKISEATRDPRSDLASGFAGQVKSLVVELEAMLASRSTSAESREAAVVAASASPPPPTSGVPTSDRPPPEVPSLPSAPAIVVPELLDATAAEQIRRQFLAFLERGCDTVRFDLSATKDLSVQGLALLALVARHVAERGRPHIGLVGLSKEMESVLKITGLRESYSVHPGAQEDE